MGASFDGENINRQVEVLDHVQQPIQMFLVLGREHDQQNPGAFSCHPRVVQALTYRLRPFPRKVNLHRVGVQNTVHTVRLWDADSGRQLALGRHEDRARSLAVGPDWIASSGDDKTIRIWDYSLRPLRTIQSETRPIGLAVHADGNRLLAGTGSW